MAADDDPDPIDQPDGSDDKQTDHERDRRLLLEMLMYAWDRARSPGVWERLTEGLAGIGVRVERPDGEPFDPLRHEVGAIQITADDGLVDTIAETEVVGFTDRGVVLREPVVVVYRRS
ncbi:MAG: nucleotide exchange factor GrpE [Williamsia herbipolensis]|nr:nucleotide exchange factor GrpE [Williamsia herbipolensis]